MTVATVNDEWITFVNHIYDGNWRFTVSLFFRAIVAKSFASFSTLPKLSYLFRASCDSFDINFWWSIKTFFHTCPFTISFHNAAKSWKIFIMFVVLDLHDAVEDLYESKNDYGYYLLKWISIICSCLLVLTL